MSSNPYAAPKSAVADAAVVQEGNFVPGGRVVPAGKGWDWIAAGWELFKKQPGMWILIFVAWLVGGMVLSFIPLVNLALNLLYLVFTAGLLIGCKALESGQPLEFGHLFAGFRDRLGALLAVAVLVLVASMAVVLAVLAVVGFSVFGAVMAGDPGTGFEALLMALLAALVILGLMVPIAMAAWFAPALVVFNDRGAIEALKESFAGCLKNMVPFLVYGVIGLVLAVLATIPIGLGWLILAPVFTGSIYAAYRDIYFTS